MISRGFVVILALLAAPAAAHADGDAAAGQKVFLKCKACHQIGENAKNAVGPELNGLFVAVIRARSRAISIRTPTRTPASSGTTRCSANTSATRRPRSRAPR